MDFPEFEIPDTADELIEGWKNDEAVIAAMQEVVEAEQAWVDTQEHDNDLRIKQGELQGEINQLLNKIKEIQRQIDDKRSEKSAIDNELFKHRTAKRRADEKIEQAKAKVRLAKENFERKEATKVQRSAFYEAAKKYKWYTGVDMPDGKTYKVMPHQMEGAIFLALGKRVILADKMGVGKTLTSLAALDLMGAKRVLIVTPADVASNFLAEIRQWSPHRMVTILTGVPKKQRDAALMLTAMMDSFVVIVNYEAWRKDSALIDKFIELQFDTVIMDEAHAMKTLRSDAYAGMQRVIHANNSCPQCGGLIDHRITSQKCSSCGWRYSQNAAWDHEYEDKDTGIDIRPSVKAVIPMTGTPILNSPEDLYPLLNLIDPVNFYALNVFLRNYAEQNYYDGKWQFRAGGVDSLMKQLSGKFISRSMDDAGVVLPEQKAIIHELEITPEDYPDQYRIMRQLSQHAAVILSDGRTLPILAQIALITRQRQSCVWPAGIKLKDADGNIVFDTGEEVNESIKLDKTMLMLKEFVGGGERVVVFSQFATGLEQLKNMCDAAGIRAVRFDGSTPSSVKEEVKRNFNKSLGEEPKWDVVLANYKTGGVGLNLTACTQMIIVDEEWNPGKRDQGYARISRIGQDQRTFVHILQLKKSIDTWQHSLINRKESMIAGFEETQQSLQAMYLQALKDGEV